MYRGSVLPHLGSCTIWYGGFVTAESGMAPTLGRRSPTEGVVLD